MRATPTRFASSPSTFRSCTPSPRTIAGGAPASPTGSTSSARARSSPTTISRACRRGASITIRPIRASSAARSTWRASTGSPGFCHYHYWFEGKQLLERPTNLFLEMKELDLSFCLSWANETWSRRWDGQEHHILQLQTHTPSKAAWGAHFDYLDPRVDRSARAAHRRQAGLHDLSARQDRARRRDVRLLAEPRPRARARRALLRRRAAVRAAGVRRRAPLRRPLPLPAGGGARRARRDRSAVLQAPPAAAARGDSAADRHPAAVADRLVEPDDAARLRARVAADHRRCRSTAPSPRSRARTSIGTTRRATASARRSIRARAPSASSTGSSGSSTRCARTTAPTSASCSSTRGTSGPKAPTSSPTSATATATCRPSARWPRTSASTAGSTPSAAERHPRRVSAAATTRAAPVSPSGLRRKTDWSMRPRRAGAHRANARRVGRAPSRDDRALARARSGSAR